MTTYLDLATAIEPARIQRAPQVSMRTLKRNAPKVPGGITTIEVTRPKSGKNKGQMRVSVSFFTSLYNPGTEAEHSPARRAAGKAQIDAQREWFLACAIDAGFSGKNAKATMEAYAMAKAMQAEAEGLAFIPPEPRERPEHAPEVLVIVTRTQRAPYSGKELGLMHYLVSAPRIVKGLQGLQINVQASTLVAYSSDIDALRASEPEATIVDEFEYIGKHAV